MEIINFIIPLFLLLVVMTLDYLFVNNVSVNMIRISDPIIHGILGACMAYVVISNYKNCGIKEILIGAAVAVLIDLDHIVAARSLNWTKLVSLGRRTWAHSLLFSLFVSIVSIIVWDVPIGYVVFSSMINHVLRDSTMGGTLLLFPQTHVYTIPYWLYVLLNMFVLFSLKLV